MRKVLVAAGAALLFTGCVTTSTFEAKEAELAAAKDDAAKRDAAQQQKISELQGELDKLQKDLASSQLLNGDLSDRLKRAGQTLQDLSNEKGNLSESLAAAQKQMEALQKQEEQERARAALYHKLVEKLKSMIDSGKLAVQIRNGKMLVKLQNDILFPAGSASVKQEGQDVLGQLAQVLASVPDRQFQVTGHTDDVPIHSAQFPSNWELSAQRAINVVKILTDAGLDPKHVSAAGYADNDPVSPNDSPDNKQKNRRIEVVVQPNIDELPKFDEPSANVASTPTPALNVKPASAH
jgi:chemotaxis protein MotB